MYYSADEHICVATADSPAGPFTQSKKEPMIADEKCIDNSLFIDDDGTPYLFFDRFNDGLNIWVAELEKDLMTIKKETMHPCIHVSQAWEEVWPRVNEGPFVIKRNGLYYMTYSANSYESPFYGIGCATATDLMGTWTKYEENPLLQKPGELVGVGHSATFTDKAGNVLTVLEDGEGVLVPRTELGVAFYGPASTLSGLGSVGSRRFASTYRDPKDRYIEVESEQSTLVINEQFGATVAISVA